MIPIEDTKNTKLLLIVVIGGLILLSTLMVVFNENKDSVSASNQEFYEEELTPQKAPTKETDVPTKVKKIEHNIEVLDMDRVWLNDVIQFSSTQNEVRTKLGEPDSISTPNFECGAYIAGEEPWGDLVNIWHYQGTKIVTFKDKTEIMTVKLRGLDCTLHHSRIIFSGHTSLSDLAKVFPISVENSYEWKDVRDGRTYQLVRIAPKPSWDDEWVLKFFNDELIEIEYWTPC